MPSLVGKTSVLAMQFPQVGARGLGGKNDSLRHSPEAGSAAARYAAGTSMNSSLRVSPTVTYTVRL